MAPPLRSRVATRYINRCGIPGHPRCPLQCPAAAPCSVRVRAHNAIRAPQSSRSSQVGKTHPACLVFLGNECVWDVEPEDLDLTRQQWNGHGGLQYAVGAHGLTPIQPRSPIKVNPFRRLSSAGLASQPVRTRDGQRCRPQLLVLSVLPLWDRADPVSWCAVGPRLRLHTPLPPSNGK